MLPAAPGAAKLNLAKAAPCLIIGALPKRSGGRSSGVERNLAKVEVVGSNPIARSIFSRA